MTARKETLHSLVLTNQPGELAKITANLAERNINILGIFAEEGAGQSLVNLVLEQAITSEELEEICDIKATQKEILAIEIHSSVGAIAVIAKKLGDNNINIGSVFASECSTSRDICCYIEVDNLEKALQIFQA